MKQALYRNWRPRSFKELVGQQHVADTLERALKTGRISHAYLFTGPRGVGKTSAARILAHLVNGLPYTDETAHLDIIEIDAASNRRIDEIRDLRDKVAIAPTTGKYKVYIIDEVHMLTREAFNALLKTLEEPPAHTIFILATTEAHKLPETIVSRTQRFEFKPLMPAQMTKHLQKIAKTEKIEITPGAIELLSEFGSGSFRDSISILDQLGSAGQAIDEEEVRRMLGMPSRQAIDQLASSIEAESSEQIINSLQQLKEQGIDAPAVASALADNIRRQVITKPSPKLLQLLRQLIEVPASSRPYDFLEISLLEASFTDRQPTQKKDVKNKETVKSVAVSIEAAKIDAPVLKPNRDFDISLWPKIVEASREKAASLYTALRLAEPVYENNELILKFQFPLHQKKLTQANNKALVADLIESISGQQVTIECQVDKEAFRTKKPATIDISSINTNAEQVNSITNIFGTAEVVEI
jgi:DNA polymerase-3 subunit gamma/tau